jgi:hypothetical protein
VVNAIRIRAFSLKKAEQQASDASCFISSSVKKKTIDGLVEYHILAEHGEFGFPAWLCRIYAYILLRAELVFSICRVSF